MRNDIDLEEAAPWLALAFVGYVILNYLRDRAASPQGVFGSAAPSQPGLDSALDIIAPMRLSPQGEAFIKSQEGLTLHAKPDAGGQSIGYGHRIIANDNIPSTISRSYAQTLFENDVATVEAAINSAVTVPLTQNQFDALADFVFNVGAGALQGSQLLTLLNQGNYSGAAAQFSRWNQSQGKSNTALTDRRSADTNLFNS